MSTPSLGNLLCVVLAIAASPGWLAAQDDNELARKYLAQNQMLRAERAIMKGNVSEAVTWYARAMETAPDGDPIGKSARNLWSAHFESTPRTLVHSLRSDHNTGRVRHVVVSPDGKTLWAATLGCRSQLWDLTTGKPIGKPLEHAGDTPSAAQFTPDSKFVLTVDYDGAVMWNVATADPAYPMIAHEVVDADSHRPAISPDGNTIITRDTDKSVRLWNAKTGRPRTDSIPTVGAAIDYRFVADGSLVAVKVFHGYDNGFDYGMMLLDSRTGERVGKPWRGFENVAFHPAGRVVAVCGDGKVHLRDLRSGERIADLEHDAHFENVVFDTKGNTLLAYEKGWRSQTESAVVWNNVLADDRKKVVYRHPPALRAAALSPDGKLAAVSDNSRLSVWRTADGEVVWEHAHARYARSDVLPGYGALEFGPNGRTLLTRCEGEVFVLRSSNGRLLAREGSVYVAGLSPDGKTLVCGTNDNTARLVPLKEGDPRFVTTMRHPGDSGNIDVARFSRDGKTVVTAGRDKIVQVWDAENWKPKGEPIEMAGGVHYLALSPDDDTLALTVELPNPVAAGLRRSGPHQIEFWSLKDRKRIGDSIRFDNAYNIHFDSVGDYLHAMVFGSDVLINVETREVTSVERRANAAGRPVAGMLQSFEGRAPRLWDTEERAPARVAIPDRDHTLRLACQSGDVLALNARNEMRLFSGRTGEPLGPLFKIDGDPSDRSHNGRYVLCGEGYKVQLWDAFTGRRCGDPLAGTHMQMATSFSPGGDVLATYQLFSTQLWDCATGQMLGPPFQNRSTAEYDLEFSPDGKWLLSVDGSVNIMRLSLQAPENVDEVRRMTEVRTGLRIDDNGALQDLRHEEWMQRVEELAAGHSR